MLDPGRTELLVGSIYDAAVDGRLWDTALVTLGKLTGCLLTSIEIYEAGVDGVRGHNPMMDPEYRHQYLNYWQHHFSLRKRTLGFPVGRVIRSSEVVDFHAGTKTAVYNDWVRPQGCGICGRYANLFLGRDTTALLSAWKPFKSSEFSLEEEHLFELAVGHFVRAVGIHRQLRLAQAQQVAVAAGAAPAGFLIVDRNGGILAAHEATWQRLHAAGLITSRGEQGSIALDDPALKKLVFGAACGPRAGMPCAGQAEHRSREGTLLRLTMIPLAERTEGSDAPWLPISEPAALILVAAPEEAARARIRQLASAHGLTPGEAAVALEVAKGDGRAAVAARLGISETTVRSHLSAIFDKLGIHRQAELTRIVANS